MELKENQRIIAEFSPWHSDSKDLLKMFLNSDAGVNKYLALRYENKYSPKVTLTSLFWGRVDETAENGYFKLDELELALSNLPKGIKPYDFTFRVVGIES